MNEIDNIATFKCNLCNGKGTIGASVFASPCVKCNGTGVIDWVSHITITDEEIRLQRANDQLVKTLYEEAIKYANKDK